MKQTARLGRRLSQLIALYLLLLAGAAACSPTPAMPPAATIAATLVPSPTPEPAPVAIVLPDFSLCWVAYSPTHYDPDIPRFPLPSDLRDDLTKLHAAGFQGVLTYSVRDILHEVPLMAKEIGFRQVILGIWDPLDVQETANAIAAAPYVDGYIVGNEGLANKSYTLDELRATLDLVRAATGKPVTTTERLESYYGPAGLRELGDWLAPIAHPFWHNYFDPAEAAEWTATQYEDLQQAAPNRAIQFKELGLPTAGIDNVSEVAQAEYYRLLQGSQQPLQFAYFEAFDQEWKAASTGLPVESYWGLFRADRSPKPAAEIVCGKTPPTPTPTAEPTNTPTLSPTAEVTLTPRATPTTATPTVRAIFWDSLAEGYQLNIDNSSHQFGWLNVADGALRVDFPAGQQWAVVYITRGVSRTQTEDLSTCDALLADLWAAQPGVEVKIGIKDSGDPDSGGETLISRTLTTEPLVYRFPLSGFTTADLTQIYLPFEAVYRGNEATTVFIDNIRLECRE